MCSKEKGGQTGILQSWSGPTYRCSPSCPSNPLPPLSLLLSASLTLEYILSILNKASVHKKSTTNSVYWWKTVGKFGWQTLHLPLVYKRQKHLSVFTSHLATLSLFQIPLVLRCYITLVAVSTEINLRGDFLLRASQKTAKMFGLGTCRSWLLKA